MKSIASLVLGVCFLACALSFTGCSDTDNEPFGPAVNVQGEWTVAVTYSDGSSSTAEWTLIQVGSGVKGTYKTIADEVTVMGTVFENQVSLVVDLPDMPVFVGTVTDNNNMAGSRVLAEGATPGTWTAIRP